tara:strand:- start:138 stop:374 length:237 start_codon:yes stop_codon:yes gene_type:complete
MATLAQKMALMEQRMNSVEQKIDKIDEKMDMLTEKLLDPDRGVTARVNRNTSYRKVITKALWVIYAVTIGVVIKLFWE